MNTYRFLLDEHMKPFVGLPLDLFGFEIIELGKFEKSFVNSATPDWLLFLAASKRGLTGIITHDESQLMQLNEVRAMEITQCAVITYRKGVRDELTKWGLLMAYAPRILRRLDRGERGAFVLPAPGMPEMSTAGTLLHRLGKRRDFGSKELRDLADRAIREGLEARKLEVYWPGNG